MADADVHERIRQRAYRLWEQEGRPEGHAEDHWRRAEAEVTGVDQHVCPDCRGTGRRGRKRCQTCGGTGRIVDVPVTPARRGRSERHRRPNQAR